MSTTTAGSNQRISILTAEGPVRTIWVLLVLAADLVLVTRMFLRIADLESIEARRLTADTLRQLSELAMLVLASMVVMIAVSVLLSRPGARLLQETRSGRRQCRTGDSAERRASASRGQVSLILSVGGATLATCTNAGGLDDLIERGIVLHRIPILLAGCRLTIVPALPVDRLGSERSITTEG